MYKHICIGSRWPPYHEGAQTLAHTCTYARKRSIMFPRNTQNRHTRPRIRTDKTGAASHPPIYVYRLIYIYMYIYEMGGSCISEPHRTHLTHPTRDDGQAAARPVGFVTGLLVALGKGALFLPCRHLYACV